MTTKEFLKQDIKTPVTKERLKNYILLKKEIDNQYKRLQSLEIQIQSYPNMIINTNILQHKTKLENTIRQNLNLEFKEILEIEEAIQLLDNPLYREVIRLRYLEGKPWTNICEEINYEKTQTYRIHDNAVKFIQIATSADEMGVLVDI